jgi:hypothetical protein
MSTIKADNWTSVTGEQYNSVLQLVEGTNTTAFSVTNPTGYYVETPLTVTLTTKRANSKFYVSCSNNCYTSSATVGWNIAIARKIGSGSYALGIGAGQSPNGATSGSDVWMGFAHDSGLAATSWTRTRTLLDSPDQPKGTSLTYTIFFGGWNRTGQGWLTYPGYSQTSRIYVMELAG